MDAVFVYGTLKRGFPNHDSVGMGNYRCLGRFRTTAAFPLVIGGPWCSPCLIDEPGIGFRVAGEVYEVDAEGLAVLDELELTHLPDGYRRIRTAVEPEGGGEALETWVYVRERVHIVPIRTGMLAEYTLDPALPRYVPRWERP